MRKRVLSFRHAYREVGEALLGVYLDLFFGLHRREVSRIE
jgi:hypothetical protein